LRKDPARHASWQELLASPAPASHIVQLYDAHDFVASAAALFAAEGLRRGEAVVLTGTEEHLCAVRRELLARDVDCDAAQRRAQLAAYDVREAADAMLTGGAPDAEGLAAYAGRAFVKARAGGRYSGLRWWGEITSFLYHQGEPRAAMLAEEIGDAAVKEHGGAVFCSFLCDRFDAQAYSVLRDMCCAHSHVIPAEDYVRHRLAVNRAIAETVGEIRGPLLQSLLSWKGLSCELPSSQALLFWVREAFPERFDDVLARVKAYQPHA
jgi:hypothetical protein